VWRWIPMAIEWKLPPEQTIAYLAWPRHPSIANTLPEAPQ
jgi:hypothetical protein